MCCGLKFARWSTFNLIPGRDFNVLIKFLDVTPSSNVSTMHWIHKSFSSVSCGELKA